MPPDWPGHLAHGVLTAILDASEDPVICRDLDGVIRAWNPAATRLYGYTADEAVGQPGTLILPPDRHDELPGLLARARSGQPIDHHETVRRAKDGGLIDVALSVTPIRGEAGEVAGVMTIARDLTARKRADAAIRTSELLWRSVVDAAVDGIIVIDARGCIEGFNRGAERLFGYQSLEVIGRNVNVLMPAPYRDEHDSSTTSTTATSRGICLLASGGSSASDAK
jgi:PAS domain S-box-containing protein